MAKITKFGTIKEDDQGNIVLDGFHLDLEFECEGNAEEYLKLVIERLEHELNNGSGRIEKT